MRAAQKQLRAFHIKVNPVAGYIRVQATQQICKHRAFSLSPACNLLISHGTHQIEFRLTLRSTNTGSSTATVESSAIFGIQIPEFPSNHW
jgi:hypothetical protein